MRFLLLLYFRHTPPPSLLPNDVVGAGSVGIACVATGRPIAGAGALCQGNEAVGGSEEQEPVPVEGWVEEFCGVDQDDVLQSMPNLSAQGWCMHSNILEKALESWSGEARRGAKTSLLCENSAEVKRRVENDDRNLAAIHSSRSHTNGLADPASTCPAPGHVRSQPPMPFARMSVWPNAQ